MDEKPPRKGHEGDFKPGQSGNPGGRLLVNINVPTKTKLLRQMSLKDMAQDDRSATFKRLQEIRDQKDDLEMAWKACVVLCQYSDGRPLDRAMTPKELGEPEKPPVSLEQLEKMLEEESH